MVKLALGQLPEDPRVDYLLSAGIFVVLFLYLRFAYNFYFKSPGKFVKNFIDDIDGGYWFFRTFLREMIFKPISASLS